MSYSASSTALEPGFATWFHELIRRQSTHYFLAAVFLSFDYITGPIFQFPILFVLPVALSAWFVGYRSALILALLQPLFRFGFTIVWSETYDFISISSSFINMMVRMGVLVLLAYFINRSASQSRELSRRVRLLTGTLPICVNCKQIQDERADWNEIEIYIARNSDTRFNYSLCPTCASEHSETKKTAIGD